MVSQLSPTHWVKKYNLQPHPEGGYYKETYRGKDDIGTNIYYLLGNIKIGHFSAWHRLTDRDEIWHYHYGVALNLYIISHDGKLITHKLGHSDDASFQVLVPANHWFAAALEHEDQEAYTLVSCSVYPAFNFEHFELAEREKLILEYPQHSEIITKLTRTD